MKLLIPLCFFFITASTFAQDTAQVSDRIFWNDWYRLEWSDFQGEPEVTEKVAALSSIALPYSYVTDGEGAMTVKINVCFLKTDSWSIKERENKVLLQHEQLHFDIAEVHRRMIVKELLLAEFTKKNYKAKLDEIVNKNWLEAYRLMQDRYDAETNFSRVFKEQIEWNKFVAQQLRNLEDYTFTEVEVSLINFD